MNAAADPSRAVALAGQGPRRMLPAPEGHDASIRSLFEAIRQLMAPPPVPPKPEIGFHVKEDSVHYRVKRK